MQQVSASSVSGFATAANSSKAFRLSRSTISIRGEPVESCKLRYFNSFEFS
jgi:hypothetical protein